MSQTHPQPAPHALAVCVTDLLVGRPRMILREYTDQKKGRITEKNELVREQPLLEVLTEAVGGGARNNSASSARIGSRMLISSDALDILQHIVATVRGYGMPGDIPSEMRGWAAACEADSLQTERLAAETAQRWCDRIRSLCLSEHELNASCPMCGETEVRYADPIGGYIRKRALFWTVNQAACRSCGESWDGELEMRRLASLIF